MRLEKFIRTSLLAAATLATNAADAFQITTLSPQGEVAEVRQLVAKFSEAAINFGDPKATAPLTVSCSDAQASKGDGRWVSEWEWAFEFERDLPPGVTCSMQVRAGLKSVKGTDLTSPLSYRFNTGGPFVQNIQPYTGSRIDEEQFFLLRLNGSATLASVQANVWCNVDGLGERVAVRLIEGADRTALLKSQGMSSVAEKAPLSVVTLACNRRLTPSSKVQLVWGKGVATPASGSSQGIPNAVEKRFDFTVREPFAATFNCERENAQAACLPIRAMSLNFNAPVARKLAEGIRLNTGKDSYKPVFQKGENSPSEGDSVINSVSFSALMPEQTQFTVVLPSGFKDASGRTLKNADSFPLKVATGAMPPLAKFAAAPFGIIERFAEKDGAALLPVTLRNVEAALKLSAT